MNELIATATEREKAAAKEYEKARKALHFHEVRDHILTVEQRRQYIGRINDAARALADAQRNLARAKVGLIPTMFED